MIRLLCVSNVYLHKRFVRADLRRVAFSAADFVILQFDFTQIAFRNLLGKLNLRLFLRKAFWCFELGMDSFINIGNGTFYILKNKLRHDQCDQIWRNFATLPKF